MPAKLISRWPTTAWLSAFHEHWSDAHVGRSGDERKRVRPLIGHAVLYQLALPALSEVREPLAGFDPSAGPFQQCERIDDVIACAPVQQHLPRGCLNQVVVVGQRIA